MQAVMWTHFDENRTALEEQYRRDLWIQESGLSPEALKARFDALCSELQAQALPLPLVKAQLFAFLLDNAQLAVVPEDFFQDHIRHAFLLRSQTGVWTGRVMSGELTDMAQKAALYRRVGLMGAACDFGHTVPDWNDLLALGFPGLLKRVRDERAAHLKNGTLSREQAVFYESCDVVYCAVLRYIHRLAAACRRAALSASAANAQRLNFCAEALWALEMHEPQTFHQGLQLAYVYHILQEEVEGERLRSLGGLDRLYKELYERDLSAGRLTRAQAGILLKDFFQKFHALTGDHLFGEPFYIGGVLPGDRDAVNDLTWLIIESYDELKIANPKIHVRLHPNNPPRLLETVCDCIRRGTSSFVFVSDQCALPMMQKAGCTADEAREYVPIGCYEPGILGREMACTGNGGIVLPKVLEITLNNGMDPLTGEKVGLALGNADAFETFDMLIEAVCRQMTFLEDEFAEIITAFERHYMAMNPAPLLSATMIECVQKGADAYGGGAKYNNSSIYAYSNATLADSLAMIYKAVYQRHEVTLCELVSILNANWEKHELLRLKLLRDRDKWGNDRKLPDSICVYLSERFARYANALKNGRGGHFKAAMFTIDHNYKFGKNVGATADGRRAHEPLSRNLGATSGQDRQGVTSMIRSCTKLDLTEFPTGSVLDIVLHPSAVAGREGLEAFCALIRSYCDLGGFAIHGNVFDAEVLRAAQREPDKYRSLQVRVCGWNVYFVNLSREEQDDFIRRAEYAAL